MFELTRRSVLSSSHCLIMQPCEPPVIIVFPWPPCRPFAFRWGWKLKQNSNFLVLCGCWAYYSFAIQNSCAFANEVFYLLASVYCKDSKLSLNLCEVHCPAFSTESSLGKCVCSCPAHMLFFFLSFKFYSISNQWGWITYIFSPEVIQSVTICGAPKETGLRFRNKRLGFFLFLHSGFLRQGFIM